MLKLPEMTHPLSAHWYQPKAEDVAVYNDIAIMDETTLEELAEYSTSIPTGAYEGKMWKAFGTRGGWYLCWYGPDDDPDMVSINRRPIRFLRHD